MTLIDTFKPKPLTLTQNPHFDTHEQFQPYSSGRPRGVMIHRSDAVADRGDLFQDNGPASIQKYYKTIDSDWRMPFALHIDTDGSVTQCVPLAKQTPHAKAANDTHLGVVCVGDFRKEQGQDIGAPQLGALVGVLAHLIQCRFITMKDSEWLVSHDAKPGVGSGIPKLESPGLRLPMEELQSLVKRQVRLPVRGLDFMISDHDRPTTRDLMQLAAGEEKVFGGDLDAALAELQPLEALAFAPEEQTRLSLSLGRAAQFKGSALLRHNDTELAMESFAQAQRLLQQAREQALAVTDASTRSELLAAVDLQILQASRATAFETVDADLLARFVELQEKLVAAKQMPAVVAFIDFLKGDLRAARQGYLQVLGCGEDRPMPGNALALCRLGQVELALKDYPAAAQNLERGIAALPGFPERDCFLRDLELAKRGGEPVA